MSECFQLNPPVGYVPEKGASPTGTSQWLELAGGTDVSNTLWRTGAIDYSGDVPEVWVKAKATHQAFASFGTYKDLGKVSAYLLHPDKFEPLGKMDAPARNFLPVVSTGRPGKPMVYGLVIEWDVPFLLSSNPLKPENPRAWFEGYGKVAACGKAGQVKIHATGKRVTVAERVVIYAKGRAPKGCRRVPRRR